MGTLEGEGDVLAGAASFENATDFVSENPTDLPPRSPSQIRALLHVTDARMGAINGCLHLRMRTIIASDLLVLLLPGSLRAPLLALPPGLPVSERPPIAGGDLFSVFKGDPLD
jgi:hypothetical protein